MSILGKLYAHRINFPNHHRVLGFVSHKHCGLEMLSKFKNETDVFFANIAPACKQRLLARLRKEHSLSADPDCDKCFQFIISDLSVLEHPRDVKGALTEFLDELVPDSTYRVGAVYRAIFDRMRRRNDREDAPTSMPELITRKSIGYTEVQSVLDNMRPIGRYSALWNEIGSDLGPNVSAVDRKNIKAGFSRYAAHKQSPSNKVAQRLGKDVRAAIEAVGNDPTMITNSDVIAKVLPLLKRLPRSENEHYVKGAILLEFHDTDDE